MDRQTSKPPGDEKEISHLEDSITRLGDRVDKDISVLRQDIAGLTNAVTANGKAISVMESRLAEQGKTVSAVETRLTEQGKTVSAVETRLTEQGKTVSAVEARLAEQGKAISVMESRLTEGQKKLEKMLELLVGLPKEVGKHTGQIDTLRFFIYAGLPIFAALFGIVAFRG